MVEIDHFSSKSKTLTGIRGWNSIKYLIFWKTNPRKKKKEEVSLLFLLKYVNGNVTIYYNRIDPTDEKKVKNIRNIMYTRQHVHY